MLYRSSNNQSHMEALAWGMKIIWKFALPSAGSVQANTRVHRSNMLLQLCADEWKVRAEFLQSPAVRHRCHSQWEVLQRRQRVWHATRQTLRQPMKRPTQHSTYLH